MDRARSGGAPSVMPVTSNAASPSPTPNVQQEVSWQLGDSLPITNTLTLQFTGIPGASVGPVDGTADVVIRRSRRGAGANSGDPELLRG